MGRLIHRSGISEPSVETGYGAAVSRAASPDMVHLAVREPSGGRVTGIRIRQNPTKQHEIRTHRN